MSARCILALAGAWLSACTGGPPTAHDDSGVDVGADAEAPPEPGAPDAALLASDASPGDGGQACTPRDLDPVWLEAYEREIVAKLAGTMPIAPGVTLADRYTSANREAVRQYLLAELTALGYTPTRHTYETGTNVVARLGTGAPGRPLYVMGAHYDGIQGIHAAADDGTGVALVLAAARWFAGVDCRDADIVFVFFDQEESGLIGSNFYAAKLMSDGEQVGAVHVFDMISFDGDHDQALELWKPSPGMAALYQAAATQVGVNVPVGVAPSFASSDHQSFVEASFVTTGVSEEFVGGDHTPHYHKVTDTYDKVQFDYLRRVSRVAFAAVSTQVAPRAP